MKKQTTCIGIFTLTRLKGENCYGANDLEENVICSSMGSVEGNNGVGFSQGEKGMQEMTKIEHRKALTTFDKKVTED